MEPAPSPFLEMRGICKHFGNVQANVDVNFLANLGECVALLGENGAGKTTLTKILFGIEKCDAGEILIDGRAISINSPAKARALGFGMVFQHFTLIPTLTVIENLLLAADQTRMVSPTTGLEAERLRLVLADIAPEIDAKIRVESLSVGECQLVELAKAFCVDPRLLVLDEPTSVLTPPEAERFYGLVENAKAAGRAVVLITHKLKDVERLADRTVILRNGRVVATFEGNNQDRETLIASVIGSETRDMPTLATAPNDNRPYLEVKNITSGDGRDSVKEVSFTLCQSEILGVAGVAGNGQNRLAQVLAAVEPVSTGEVLLDGKSCQRTERAPPGVPSAAFIPEHPRENAVAPNLANWVNVHAHELRKLPFLPDFTGLKKSAGQRLVDADVRPADPDLRTGALSGGNLQKLVVARELSQEAGLIVASHPTMGLDVAATDAVYRQLFAKVRNGACLVWISEDVDELLQYAHRIAVMFEGRLVACINAADADRMTIGRWMIGHDLPTERVAAQ